MLKPHLDDMEKVREDVNGMKYSLEAKINPNPTTDAELGDNLLLISQHFNDFFKASIKIIIFTSLLFFIASSLFKAVIWSRISKKEFNSKSLQKFILIKTIWVGCWVILFLIIFKALNPYYSVRLSLLLLVSYFYFTNILHPCFDNKKKIGQIFRLLFKLSVMKSYYFILPYLFYIIALMIAATISIIFGILITPILSFVMGAVFLVVISTLFKLYLYHQVEKIK